MFSDIHNNANVWSQGVAASHYLVAISHLSNPHFLKAGTLEGYQILGEPKPIILRLKILAGHRGKSAEATCLSNIWVGTFPYAPLLLQHCIHGIS